MLYVAFCCCPIKRRYSASSPDSYLQCLRTTSSAKFLSSGVPCWLSFDFIAIAFAWLLLIDFVHTSTFNSTQTNWSDPPYNWNAASASQDRPDTLALAAHNAWIKNVWATGGGNLLQCSSATVQRLGLPFSSSVRRCCFSSNRDMTDVERRRTYLPRNNLFMGKAFTLCKKSYGSDAKERDRHMIEKAII